MIIPRLKLNKPALSMNTNHCEYKRLHKVAASDLNDASIRHSYTSIMERFLVDLLRQYGN